MIWRWHFYAGLFCIPLVIWLALTGSIYLFKPQIERWLDRPYDHLTVDGARATPEQIATVAVAAVPGASLHYYELPPSDHAAVRVIVGVGTKEYRVYVHPQSRAVLHTVEEDRRPMRVLFYLHGELMAGKLGSYLVELAASWAVVLLVTGVYLWWPRQIDSLAGVLYVRLRKGSRLFWRDLHAVTGLWISALALFLILTGLPWAAGWGSYFKGMRSLTGTGVARQDWATSRSGENTDRAALNNNSTSLMDAMPGMEHSGHTGHWMHHMTAPDAYAPLNQLVPVAQDLKLASPVEIMPAMLPGGSWTIKSDAQNRPQRVVLRADPKTGAIKSRQGFAQRLLLDRIVGVGVAAHEGQLFGVANQLLGLFAAMGLVLLCVSAAVMWWKRRHVGSLGAPIAISRPRWTVALIVPMFALLLYLPAFLISSLLVLLLERYVLSRMTAAGRWLGLRHAA
ncbi:PepSY-associated TM helix domain-containing protein [Granulicella cerasi]|uniref:PepSY-associated TM helix domain-containing protein n=1 Tax=Granulicella cerasi TaxID=741063 RepID=A0ABW1Z5D8_9BACT|nr:PepSY domain-containing protein [Granulicella cerasi]